MNCGTFLGEKRICVLCCGIFKFILLKQSNINENGLIEFHLKASLITTEKSKYDHSGPL